MTIERPVLACGVLAALAALAATTVAGPPDGDECADCIPVGEGSFAGTTADNTGIGDDTSCGFGDSVDEWYCYTPTCTGVATASTCGAADFDTSLAAFDACGGTQLACNDDAVGCGLASEVSWAVDAGTVYFVRVSGFAGQTGSYTVTISCDGPLVNDECAGAIEIFDGSTPFDTAGAVTDGPDLAPFCDPGPFGDDQVHNDIWFDYEATCSGALTVSTCGTADYDTRLAVYPGTDCPVDPESVLACNDDSPGCAGFTSELEVSVVAGELYKIRVGGFSDGDVGSGTIQIAPTPSSATLSLDSIAVVGGLPPGTEFDVHVNVGNLCLDEAAGFQAFIEFDTDELMFLEGSYTSEPFGLPVIFPIEATPGGEIDVASGINQFIGQEASSADALLAVLTFEVIETPAQCAATISFRDHEPPTRITDVGGNEILPLDLVVFPPPRAPGDVNFDGTVNVDDLIQVILEWGDCPPPPDFCFADLDCNGVVNVEDLIEVVLNWSV